jgi:hypothetical protein
VTIPNNPDKKSSELKSSELKGSLKSESDHATGLSSDKLRNQNNTSNSLLKVDDVILEEKNEEEKKDSPVRL